MCQKSANKTNYRCCKLLPISRFPMFCRLIGASLNNMSLYYNRSKLQCINIMQFGVMMFRVKILIIICCFTHCHTVITPDIIIFQEQHLTLMFIFQVELFLTELDSRPQSKRGVMFGASSARRFANTRKVVTICTTGTHTHIHTHTHTHTHRVLTQLWYLIIMYCVNNVKVLTISDQ